MKDQSRRPPTALAGPPRASREGGPAPFSGVPPQARSGLSLLGSCRRYLHRVAASQLDSGVRTKCDESDLVQNTLVQAVDCFDQFRGQSRDSLLGWLRVILRNEAGRIRRVYLTTGKRKVSRELRRPASASGAREHVALVDRHPTPAGQAMANEQAMILRAALDRLSSDHRRVILLRNWERMSFAEIAARLERSEDAVKKLWGRAILRLRRELEDVRAEPE